MTAQFSDPVAYRGQSYSIAGKNGTGLFDPAQHGMKPVGKCSACWHGFVCSYSVDDRRLQLEELAICLNEPAPILFGGAGDRGQAAGDQAVDRGVFQPGI